MSKTLHFVNSYLHTYNKKMNIIAFTKFLSCFLFPQDERRRTKLSLVSSLLTSLVCVLTISITNFDLS